ncbi:MAG: insulinase family protein [Sphingomonadaceae bacterium]
MSSWKNLTLRPLSSLTIGSMADLSGATLEDVKQWFRDNYGPNNAILVLAGDIDLPTAKEKVTKWFDAIPRGPEIQQVEAPVPDLPTDPPRPFMTRCPPPASIAWAVPGLGSS